MPGQKKESLKKNISNDYKNLIEDSTAIRKIINDILGYFKGKNVRFDYPLDMGTVTDFQKKVYKKTKEIPFGSIKTYKWVAEKIGISGGARAVGNALSKNPIPLIVPCHRVVGSNGNLGGFSGPGGVLLKNKMLMIEGWSPGAISKR